MAERRPRLGLWLGLASGALFLAGILLFQTAPDPESVAPAGEEAALRTVMPLRVRAVPLRARAEVSGVLEARRTVTLSAETRGSVLSVGAEALDAVEEGQVLVGIDPLQAQAELERASATVARNESELALARSNLERRRSLREQGVTSESVFEDAENAAKVAVAALRQSRAERTQARDELAKKIIRAPFAGVLRSFDVEVGEYLSAGQMLGELLDLETARATIGVSDREVVAVQAGQKVEVRVEAWPEETFEGRILRVGSASDRVTKKFPVEIEVPNLERRLLPGMIMRVALELGTEQPRTVIPRESTLDEFGLRFVWLLASENGGVVARRRRVRVRAVPFSPGIFEVTEGLDEGDEIALTGVRQLREGERVRREAMGGPDAEQRSP